MYYLKIIIITNEQNEWSFRKYFNYLRKHTPFPHNLNTSKVPIYKPAIDSDKYISLLLRITHPLKTRQLVLSLLQVSAFIIQQIFIEHIHVSSFVLDAGDSAVHIKLCPLVVRGDRNRQQNK